MNTKLSRALVSILATAIFCTPNDASGQAGPFIDWLQKMSGPQFWPAGATVSFGYWPGQRMPARATEEFAVMLQAARRAVPSVAAASETMRRTSACVDALKADVPIMQRHHSYHEATVDRIRVEGRNLERQAGDSGATTFYTNAHDSDRLCVWQNAISTVLRDFRMRDPMHGFVLRLGLFRAHDTLDEEADTIDVEILAFQPTLEYRRSLVRDLWIFSIDAGIESGVSLLYFHGHDIDPFWHTIVPLLANVHPFARHPWLLLRGLRIGGGGYIIPSFRSDAFAPGIANHAERTEWSWTAFTAFELSLSFMSAKSCGC